MRSLGGVALAGLVLVAAAAPVFAQDQAVFFQHGWMADPGTWGPTATRLAQEFQIREIRVDTVWSSRLGTQADRLFSLFPTPHSEIGVGHSNGGLIMREFSRRRPLSGIVTVGTLHHGAPLMYNAASLGNVYFHLFQDAVTLGGPGYAPDLDWVQLSVQAVVSELIGRADNLSLALFQMGDSIREPVRLDMIPGSSFLESLNSTANLQRESAEIPIRIAITSVADNFSYGAPARAFDPEHADTFGDWIYTSAIGFEFAAAVALGISDPSNTEAVNWGMRLAALGDAMFLIDPLFCNAVASTAYVLYDTCAESDGVVPEVSQHWPGAAIVPMRGPAHIQETQSALTRANLEDLFANTFHIPPRAAAPPPLPPPACTIQVVPTTIEMSMEGGSRLVAISTGDPACTWAASSQLSWVHVQPSNGTGSGTVTVQVDHVTSANARRGTISVAGKTVLVVQDGAGCDVQLSPHDITVGKDTASGAIALKAQRSSCTWTTQSDASWVTVTAGQSGVGNGTIQYAIAANPTPAPRTATLTAGGGAVSILQQPTQLPVVAIRRPGGDALFARGASIQIEASADASDNGSSISAVDFYADASLIGTVTSAPYVFNWTPASSGRHILQAKAHDTAGNLGVSAMVSIGVSNLESMTVTPSSLVAGQAAQLTVTGENPCGAVTVDYGDGRRITYPITGLPFQRTVDWPSGGIKTVLAIGEANCAGVLQTSVTVAGNNTPTVALTAPADLATVVAPATISMAATASDNDGTVTRVDFYSANLLLGSDTSAPYSFSWTNVPAGTYRMHAEAVDNGGAVGVSSERTLFVTDVATVLVSPASPREGQPATVTVTGSSTCGAIEINYGDGTVITYPITGLPIGRTHTWSSPGSRTIIARGQGNCEGSTTTTVTIGGNAHPTVSVTAPAEGAEFVAGSTVTMGASATDADGAITRVEFYDGTTLLTTDTTSPYGVSWTPQAGTHSLSAKAYDDLNAMTASTSRTISVVHIGSVTVSPSPVVQGQPTTITVNGSATGCGAVEINYGDGVVNTYALSSLPYQQTHAYATTGVKTITARGQGNCLGQKSTSLTVNTNTPPTVALTAPATGAVYTAPATIALSATASDAQGINRVEFYAGATLVGTATSAPYTVTWSNVTLGTYSVTARAYDGYLIQNTSAAAIVTVAPPQVTSVIVSTPRTQNAAATVTVNGTNPCGAVTINYGDGTANTYAITALPYSQNHVWTTGGTKVVTATGQGNCGGQVSTSINVNSLPLVSITSPVSGNNYLAPASITFTSSGSAPDGSIARVDYYVNGGYVGGSTVAPYSIPYSNVAVGAYSVVAVATDNASAQRQSAAVPFTASAAGPSKVTSLTVSDANPLAGQSVTLTVLGTNPCGAVMLNFGDGNVIYWPITALPYSRAYSWASPGPKTIVASGQGNCSGQTSLTITVR
jgi:pimeloyl-ACP methyl ester carboxylesterase